MIIVGDFNVSHTALDHCDPDADAVSIFNPLTHDFISLLIMPNVEVFL